MKKRLLCGLLLLGALALGLKAPVRGKDSPEGAVLRTLRFSNQEANPAFQPRNFLLSPEVVADPKDGSIRLAHSVLLADEMGATDWRQSEPLSDRVWAKKEFVLARYGGESAELYLFGSAIKIRVNRRPVGSGERLPSTGWTRVKVPANLLKSGSNEIVLGGGGSLLLEPGRQPGRSFKSTDGGKTWSNRRLGKDANQRGEYLVRLRLGRYAPQGWAESPVFDLWTGAKEGIGRPGRLLVAVQGIQEVKPSWSRFSQIRTGCTPTPDPKTWTDWSPFNPVYVPAAGTERHRWAQLRFTLGTLEGRETPRVPPRFPLIYKFLPDPDVAGGRLEVVPSAHKEAPPLRGSVPFVYQAPSPRLKYLRERYQLDKVIAPGKTEMEQLMLLRHWVRNQWHTAWGSHPAAWMPPWDALIILDSKDQPDCLTMCTHYAAVYTQCCLALGWNARHCILDHHCTMEVYVNQFRKWVMMDAGNSAERPDCTLHFERDGVPLSARELQQVYRSGQTQGITVHFTPARLMAKIAPLCRPAPRKKQAARPDVIPLADLPKYPVCGLSNYRRYAFPARNTYLDSPFPGELYQGWSEYFYDGYWWVGDSPDDPKTSPEYSRHLDPVRPQDIDWPLNWTRIHLARTARPGELRVDLETFTPNLARVERSDGKGPWKGTPASFAWKLRPGRNELRVRGVNLFQRPGTEAKVVVTWAPGK